MCNMIKVIFTILVIFCLNIMVEATSKSLVISGAGDFKDVKLDKVIVSGGADITNSEFEALVISGSMDFTDLKVTELLTISGSANGNGLEAQRLVTSGSFAGDNVLITGDVSISGSSMLTNTRMKGETKISGGLEARNSEFNNLIVNSHEITFYDSTAHNITIEDNKKPSVIQKIILKGNSVILGDVIFKAGNGQIIQDKTSSVKGKIEGGKLVKS